MSINITFFVLLLVLFLSLSAIWAVGFAPLNWSNPDPVADDVTKAFARYLTFSWLIGALVVGLYQAATLMVRQL